jgi:hypothetical protein
MNGTGPSHGDDNEPVSPIPEETSPNPGRYFAGAASSRDDTPELAAGKPLLLFRDLHINMAIRGLKKLFTYPSNQASVRDESAGESSVTLKPPINCCRTSAISKSLAALVFTWSLLEAIWPAS